MSLEAAAPSGEQEALCTRTGYQRTAGILSACARADTIPLDLCGHNVAVRVLLELLSTYK